MDVKKPPSGGCGGGGTGLADQRLVAALGAVLTAAPGGAARGAREEPGLAGLRILLVDGSRSSLILARALLSECTQWCFELDGCTDLATLESVQAHVWCAVQGLGERVAVRLLDGKERASG